MIFAGWHAGIVAGMGGEQQIPYGDDKQKGKCKANNNCKGQEQLPKQIPFGDDKPKKQKLKQQNKNKNKNNKIKNQGAFVRRGVCILFRLGGRGGARLGGSCLLPLMR